MKNTRKGFTLVELLAVIVILAIIMIIAIPAVLTTMQTARQKSFAEYVTKVYTAAQNQYMTEKANNKMTSKTENASYTVGSGASAVTESMICYIYDIKTDIGLTSTGDYTGDVVICEGASATSSTIKILARLTDNSFHTIGAEHAAGLWNYTDANAPEASNIRVGAAKNDSDANQHHTAINETAINAALGQRAPIAA